MDRTSTRTHVIAGLVASLVVSLALCYWIGIGGALLATVVGTVAAAIASGAVGKAEQEEVQMAQGAEQLEGVLDSSQLGDDGYTVPSPQAMDARRRRFAVAAAIALALLTAGGVQLATRGAGIHFYLGAPFLGTQYQRENKVPQRDGDSVSTSTEQWSQDDTYTYYDTGEPTQEFSDTAQQEAPQETYTQEQTAPVPQPTEQTQPTTDTTGRGESAPTETPTQAPTQQETHAPTEATPAPAPEATPTPEATEGAAA